MVFSVPLVSKSKGCIAVTGPALLLTLASSALAQECFPPCRSGYVCSPGAQCVSACNPPCEAGNICTGKGECTPAPKAAPTSTAPRPADDACHAEAHDRRTGFYVRLGLGPGGGPVIESPETTSMVGGVSELLLGFAIVPGLALGAGVLFDLFRDNSYSKSVVLFTPGVVADFYPNPLRGFHLQTFFGRALSNQYDSYSGVGGSLGVGYEWNRGKRLGVGILGRVEVARVSRDDDSLNYIIPGVLLSGTYF